MIDLTKPVQTSHGSNPEPVTIITTEGRGHYPVVGYIGDSNKPTVWTKEGRKQHGLISSDDLMNVPPPKRGGYINIYTDNETSPYIRNSREAADGACNRNDRIACIKIEYIEGQFDD